MNNARKTRIVLKDFLRDERGIAAIYMAVCLPVFMGFAALTVQGSYMISQRNMLQVTAEVAALAATAALPDPNAALSAAQTYAAKNMPAATYGNVLASSDVIVGKWTQGCAAGGQACFAAGATPYNAVKVTTRRAAANGNRLQSFYTAFASSDIGATAIATFGAGTGAGTWNAIIVEDISQSFATQLTNARAADQALLDCMQQNAAAGSKLGITLFTGVSPSPAYQNRISVSDPTNYNTLKNKIKSINPCDSVGMPACSGSNAAVGMNSALSQYCPSTPCPSAGPAGSRQSIVIVTDGIPNCGSTRNCSDAQLKSNAVSAANTAAANNIDVYTIYYGTSSSDAAWLATLIRGNGTALKTPTAAQLPALMQQICSQMPHRLVW
jgi:hypothetical protein